MEVKQSVATKAFILNNGRVLILRESKNYKEGTNFGKYDVPGGRIKPGQKYDESLHREIKEETGLEVKIGRPFHVGEWRPNIGGIENQIIGIFFECFSDSENVSLSRDHDRHEWINPEEYKNHDLIPGLERVFNKYLESKK